MPRRLQRRLEPSIRGGQKPTLELQLASSEMCSACRSVSTLPVLVDDRTPFAHCAPRATNIGSDATRSKACLSIRISVVWALRLAWVWELSEFVQLRASVHADSLESVVWSKGLQHLVLDTSLEGVAMEAVRWQPILKHRFLCFEVDFNQPIVGVVWPISLQRLSFANKLQPARHRSRAAGVSAGPVVSVLVQPAHRRDLWTLAEVVTV